MYIRLAIHCTLSWSEWRGPETSPETFFLSLSSNTFYQVVNIHCNLFFYTCPSNPALHLFPLSADLIEVLYFLMSLIMCVGGRIDSRFCMHINIKWGSEKCQAFSTAKVSLYIQSSSRLKTCNQVLIILRVNLYCPTHTIKISSNAFDLISR